MHAYIYTHAHARSHKPRAWLESNAHSLVFGSVPDGCTIDRVHYNVERGGKLS